MGIVNAKVSSDNTGYEKIMVHEGLGVTTDNGERCADMCAVNNLVIGGSIFPHNRIDKATWRLSDLKKEKQIDHVRVSLQDLSKMPESCSRRSR